MSRSRFTRGAAVCAAAALAVAACGGDDDDVADDVADAVDDAADEAEDAVDDAADEAEDAAEDVADEVDDAVDEATGEPIKIGLLTSLTANFAPWGLQVADGMRMAVEEVNAAGGVDGRPLELVEADTENDAERAVAGFERLAEEGVIAIAGPISSTVGLAVSPLAEELEIPTLPVKSGAAEVLTRDSRYLFRTCIPGAPMVAEPVLQYAQSEGLTKVGAIIADYGWGQSVRAALEDDFGAADGIELQVEVAPVG